MKQIIKFCIVGLSNVFVSLIAYYFCIFIGFSYVFANIISWVIGVFNSFYWNNKYVFKSESKWWQALVKSYASYASSLVLGLILMSVLIELLKVSVYIAPLIVMAIMTPVNFFLNKLWVFRR